MSGNAWVTRADVLKDLSQVNGRNAGANHLDQYVVEGDKAPPNRLECADEDEMQYHFGPGCNMPGVSNTAPDLRGIARMLQMVDDLEDSPESDEPKTLFRDTLTDEINISKLNPNVTEFVPYGVSQFRPQTKPKPLEKFNGKSPRKFDANKPTFIRKGKKVEGNFKNKTETKAKNERNVTMNSNNSESQIVEAPKTLNNTLPKKVIETDNLSLNSSPTHVDQSSSETNTYSGTITKKLDVSKMKPEEIEKMKNDIKAKIIVSSKDTCIQKKRDRNVAMATLLKLCTTPTPKVSVQDPILLITPQYYETLSNGDAFHRGNENESSLKNTYEPADEDFATVEPPKAELNMFEPAKEDIVTVERSITEFNRAEPAKPEFNPSPVSSTSAKSDEKERKYIDPLVEESISKVNDWFQNTGRPKQKPPADAPLKEALTFKKKCISSTGVVSPTGNSETSSDKKKTCGTFVPSQYANDLLLKYEKNAKTKVVPKEDLGTMLERQLKERDQQLKKKLLEKRNAMAPVSGLSVQ